MFATKATPDEATAFDRFIELFARLRERGELDVVKSGDGSYSIIIHDWDRDSSEVETLLQTIHVQKRPEKGDITVPLRFFVGEARGDGLDLETPSALEVIEAAGLGVEVPADHESDGLVRTVSERRVAQFITVRSSKDKPPQASIAIFHRDWWFFIDAHDSRSKQAFLVLRTLIGLRMDESAAAQAAPVLTVPVGR